MMWLANRPTNQGSMLRRNSVSQRKVAFGSCQDRPIFPIYFAHDRLGNKMLLRGPPRLGPGCYDSHTWGTIAYDLMKQGNKAFTLSARAAVRFPAVKKSSTPSPQTYQKDWVRPKQVPPSKVPFQSSEPRFRALKLTKDFTPGPGAYIHDELQNRKVSWPMKFGATDWNQVLQPQKITLRAEASSERDFKKQRNKVAHLGLYFNTA